MLEVSVQIAVKIALDSGRQVVDIARVAKKSRATFDYFVAERAHVGGDYRHTKAVGQEHNAALENLLVRERHYIRRFEIKLGFFIGNKLKLADNSPIVDTLNDLLDLVDVRFGSLLWFAGHD